jgi:microcystin-dependent protein
VQPYVGEIRMFGGSFAPAGWAFCDGTPLPISENEVLFQLIGTTYGGDGQSTFALPDLRGRVPVHMGTGPDGTTYQLGEASGVEQVTLTVQQIPSHTHPLTASTAGGGNPNPEGNVLAQTPASIMPYIEDSPQPASLLNQQSVTPVGGSQPHENIQPYLGIQFILSLFGVYPSQT